MFNAGDEKNFSYVNLTDMFRENALWFYFDLKENGRPAYMAPVNLFPHQTAVFYNGSYMNNPVHGMYNLQFLSVPNSKSIEVHHGRGGMQTHGWTGGSRLQVTPDSRYSQEPWTRILYKQGVFGFSMLDISFVKSFSDKFTLQLGGFNNLYDGTLLTAAFQGTNFRAEANWLPSPELYIKVHAFLDRHKIGLAQYEVLNELVRPLLDESRDDYFVDITWFSDQEHRNRFHFQFFVNTYLRELWDENNADFYMRYEHARYGTDINYNLDVGIFKIIAGGGALYTRVWGSPFTKTYYPHSGNVYASAEVPLGNAVKIHAGVNAPIQKDYTPEPNIFVDLHTKIAEKYSLNFGFSRSTRLPNAGERFFDFDTLFGNQNLEPEVHTRLEAMFKMKVTDNWSMQLDGGLHRVSHEIIWKDPQYMNASSNRDFVFTGVATGVAFWKFDTRIGGQYSFADVNVAPRSSAWGKIHFHDVWLNGALILDLYGWAHFYDEHNDLFFDPRLDRFYVGENLTESYYVLNWKAVATIQEARVFFEMDNALSADYEVIQGYQERYYRWRFGIDWILWD
jgi:hypothetical protein